jgi:hypothetical protein
MENWNQLTKQLDNNINGGWSLEDCIYEYTEQTGILPEEMEGINKFLESMDKKYQDLFINFDLRIVINRTWNHTMSNLYNLAFLAVVKEAIIIYYDENC